MNKAVKSCVVILLLIILATGGAFFYYRYEISLRPAAENTEVGFEVKKGWGSDEIALALAKRNLIKSRFAFKIYVYLSGNTTNLKAGVFAIPQNATIPEVVEILVKGDEQKNKITLIEGWRLEEIDNYLLKKGVAGDFLATAKVGNYKNQFSFLKDLDEGFSLEGYIFPDTYVLSPEPTVDELITKALRNFEEKIKTISPSDNSEILNLRGLVTLASIIERESALNGKERRKIAGVFVNRLQRKKELEADPTVQYSRDSIKIGNLGEEDRGEFEFWKGVSEAELSKYNSAYNTYLNKGLPPGPICNPGLDSLSAAFHPERHDFLYFFHKKDGEVVFSKTAAEHESRRRK